MYIYFYSIIELTLSVIQKKTLIIKKSKIAFNL